MKLLSLIFLFTMISCSHMMRSGRYVQLKRGQHTPEKVANLYGVSKDLLLRHNKKHVFRPGNWAFIPRNIGIYSGLNNFNNSYYQGIFSSGEYAWPVPASKRISSYFGIRGRKHHDGIDIAAPIGSHIVAAQAGKVIYAGNRIRGYGKMVIIKHSGNVHSVYAHAQKIYVSKGDTVSINQVIAKVGMTGRTSGPHLHFEIRVGDDPKNPIKFLRDGSRLAGR